MSVGRAPERFTPWAMCPACQRVDLHSLRATQPFDPSDPASAALDKILALSWMWSSERMTPSEEACYEVIRTCRCGREWGQEPSNVHALEGCG